MLKRKDSGVIVQNALALADYIEKDASPFDMREVCSCIGGRCRKMLGLQLGVGSGPIAAFLGISRDDCHRLLVPHEDRGHPIWDSGPHEAAAVVRHLALTGQVDWSIVS